MRAVNLIPPELRARAPGEGDPRVAYGVFGGLVLLLVMVLLAVMYSNKATTLNDEAAALRAEASRHQVKAKPEQPYNDFAGVAKSRTLLVGGLGASRFPWGSALYNLSRSLPPDVTLETIKATTADSAAVAANQQTGGAAVASAAVPSMELSGCSSGWIGFSRFVVWLRSMPGVDDVTTTDSNSAPSDTSSSDPSFKRKANCGPSPLTFTVRIVYKPREVNLVGLPKVESSSAAAGASGGTGATGAAPAPASSTTPSSGG